MVGIESRPQALLVLGMHRSGTSAVTGLTGILGAQMPAHQIGAGAQNAKGFFEAKAIARLNDRLLGLRERTWDSWSPMTAVTAAEAPELVDEALELLESEFGDAPLIALKDPRICRLVPFWIEVLERWGRHVTFLLPIRHPVEVAQSLQSRNGLDLQTGILIWINYVLEAEAFSRDKTRLFANYAQLLETPFETIGKIRSLLPEAQLKSDSDVRKAVADFLDPSLRHQKETTGQPLPALVKTIYAIFQNWALSGENTEDYATLDRIRERVRRLITTVDDSSVALQSLSFLQGGTTAEQPASRSEVNMTKSELVQGLEALRATNAALHVEIDALQAEMRLRDTEMRLMAQGVTQRDHELATLGKLLIQCEAKLETNHHTYQRMYQKRHTLDKVVQSLKTENDRTRSKHIELQDQYNLLNRENTELHALVARVENERHAIASSTFWRASAPLRKILNIFR
ncbi:sulfotransferase family protein [Cognatishimia maritima]|uniref:Sulfotransferase family protein n=1 Tax=Cognatishimia maritima TaxID=870908 RepID=A0A1M5WFH8_9RHOB|nr:hypothetical protein [Cognatishimia maritima]SHH86309.1 hypothetical protein SAMN04488044_0113 [Cognatishimia maritima]